MDKAYLVGTATSSKSAEIIHPSQYSKEIQLTRVHEAGHAVMAYLQGFDIAECVVNDRIGNTKLNILNLINNKQHEEIILVFYAGAISERIINGNFRLGCIGIDGTSDFEMAEKYIRNLLLVEDNEYGYTTGGEQFENAVREKSLMNVNSDVLFPTLLQKPYADEEIISTDYEVIRNYFDDELYKVK